MLECALLGATDYDYIREVATRIANAIERASWQSQIVAKRSRGVVHELFINRRRPVLGVGLRIPGHGRVINAPHAKGSADGTIDVFILEKNGRAIALMWGAACHPVSSPYSQEMSSCFPGYVRGRLRADIGQEIPVLFLQGYSGDVRPAFSTRRPPTNTKRLIMHVLAGWRGFCPPSEDAYIAWCERLFQSVRSTVRIASHTVAHPMEGGCVVVEADVQRGWERIPKAIFWRLTAHDALLAVNAEVMNERRSSLSQHFPNHHLMPVSCADEVIGYWPTDNMLEQGGYEGRTSQRYFPNVDWDAEGGPDALWKQLLESTAARVLLEN